MDDNRPIERAARDRRLQILLVEDSSLDAELIEAKLADAELECTVLRVETRTEFVSALENTDLDLILSDYSLPAFDGLSALQMAQKACPDVPFIFVSGAIGDELAIETLKLGATDYVLKDRLGRLAPAVRRALRESAERAERATLAAENMRLYRETEAAARREHRRCLQMRALADASLLINSALSLETMLQIITDEACEVIGAHHAITRLVVDGDWSQAITAVSLSNRYGTWSEHHLETDGLGIESLVCRTNRPLRLTQAELEAHPARSQFAARLGQRPLLRGWLAAPLGGWLTMPGCESENLGLIELSDKYDGDFTEEDQAILVQLAQLASVAIANARLYHEAQEEARRKDEFLAMLAHELRNPLGAISAAIHLTRSPRTDPSLHGATDVIERQTDHMARLLDDLLEISRVTRGRIELRKERLDASGVLANAVEATRHAIEGREHQLAVTLPAEPLWVDADPTRLEQVFTNLLNNAAKYTEPGGQIRMVASRDQNTAVIRVCDTGVGIPPQMLHRIFEPFTRVDQSLDRSDGGLGIGLTLVRHLVDMHGGSVAAASPGLGQGSEFVVRLPLASTPNPRAAVGRDSPQGPSRRILIVEDNADVRSMMRDLLILEGHQVQEAADGLEGLETIRRDPPEVALIDIGLPGLDGYQVARKVRSAPAGRSIQLIALTGYGQPEDRRRALEAGFDAHVVKPVKPKELFRMLAGSASGP